MYARKMAIKIRLVVGGGGWQSIPGRARTGDVTKGDREEVLNRGEFLPRFAEALASRLLGRVDTLPVLERDGTNT